MFRHTRIDNGGKRRWAEKIWERLGNPDNYIEPFYGSGAVLLHRDKPCAREVISDISPHIVNFWRAVRAEPLDTALAADYPTYHDDLHARHKWLILWAREFGERVQSDESFYDTAAAGWWVWGICSWIGGASWCIDRGDVAVSNSIQKTIANPSSGGGVQAQRVNIPRVQGRDLAEHIIGSGTRLQGWFDLLSRRVADVRMINGDWKEALDQSLINSSDTTAVLLDPPYKMDKRVASLYQSDANKASDAVAD